MPSSEKMMMKRKMSSSRDMIDFMLLSSDRIRFRSDVQYLHTTDRLTSSRGHVYVLASVVFVKKKLSYSTMLISFFCSC